MRSAGNLLLNVGPKPDGTIPLESVRILHEASEWLRRHGESIRATDRSRIAWTSWAASR